jgi:RIO kinase 2
MLQDITREFKNLQRYDFRVLRGIETAMQFFKWVPLDELPNYVRLPRDEVHYRIGRLLRRKLVQRKTAHYIGYKLTFAGYDVLGIETLVRKNVIESLGSKVGVGKESDVYDAKREDGKIVIVKFHREGTTFRHVKRSRGYFGQAERCSWMLASKLAAEKEYEALMKLQELATVPKPLAQNRHIIVMEFLEGRQMSTTALETPLAVFNEIILQIKLAYESGIVHADLSEYNVIVCAGGKVALIDWPQWVPLSHPNAEELLARDVGNLLAYFARKYQVTKRIEDCVEYVKHRDSASLKLLTVN